MNPFRVAPVRPSPPPWLFVVLALAQVAAPTASAAGDDAPTRTTLWEAELPGLPARQEAYDGAVEALVSAFERETGRRLQPGPKKRAGLKVYAESGPGLATPPALVRATIRALERRGFAAGDIFLVGLNAVQLREAGYLPSVLTGADPFRGHPVYVLESGRHYDPAWFYDNPLPSRFEPVWLGDDESVEPVAGGPQPATEDRKSLLAAPLFLEADFWINLPAYTDHPVLGVNGALANATLWNASNTARFFQSAASAPAAVAEMSAIPELRETWVFTLASLERYQFIGGPRFNSLYTVSEPLVWLGTDPVLMDGQMKVRMDRHRQAQGFEPIADPVRLLVFAERLGVGVRAETGPRRVAVPEKE